MMTQYRWWLLCWLAFSPFAMAQSLCVFSVQGTQGSCTGR